MKLQSDNIGGLPIKTVRDVLRRAQAWGKFSIHGVAHELRMLAWRDQIDELVAGGRIPKELRSCFTKDFDECIDKGDQRWGITPVLKKDEQAQTLIETLIKDGYAEPKDGHFELTVKGNALEMTRFVRRIDRAKADALLKGVIERAKEINARRDLLYAVKEIKAFGSYVTDADNLGDVDLAVELERRQVNGDFSDACLAFAESSGRSFSNISQKFSYSQTSVRRLLKNRSPYISLHDMSELRENPELFGEVQTIYRCEGTVETHQPATSPGIDHDEQTPDLANEILVPKKAVS